MAKKPKKQGTRHQRYVVYRDGPRCADVHVGARVRERRVLVGMTQDDLGKGVGLTFQQIQKYERGVNRISASRLWDFSKVLGVHVSWFFKGLDEKSGSKTRGDVQLTEEGLHLVRYYLACPKKVRKTMLSLFRDIAALQSGK